MGSSMGKKLGVKGFKFDSFKKKRRVHKNYYCWYIVQVDRTPERDTHTNLTTDVSESQKVGTGNGRESVEFGWAAGGP